MKIIGITGGIGSGKTTVCKLFAALGVPVFYSDKEAKRLMTEDPIVREEVIAAFGTESYVDGQLNRKHLASIVFQDKAQLEILNGITHPAVGRATMRWAEANAHHAYGVKEAAILFESGSHLHCDKTINVWAPAQIRIDRVMQRDQVTAQKVRDRMANQISETLRLALCDYVIKNDGREMLAPQVWRLHSILKMTIPKSKIRNLKS